jgi:tetratricopeptide (TPR) repeat protein
MNAEKHLLTTDQVVQAQRHLAEGNALTRNGRLIEAEASYRAAIALSQDQAMPHNNLGWIRQTQGDVEGAIQAYRQALQIEPSLGLARRNMTTLLVRLGRRDESLALWQGQHRPDSEDLAWLDKVCGQAMAENLWLAGEYAHLLTAVVWGSQCHTPGRDLSHLPPLPHRPKQSLTIPKLRHDVQQLRYLQERGVLGEGFTEIVAAYQHVINQLAARGIRERVPLDNNAGRAIAHVYNRVVHIRHTPRLARAISGGWDPEAVQRQYVENTPGVVVIDDFLTPEALQSLRQFCLESTIWFANRYDHGRLGAFFCDGFNCPLLLHISEELQEALPRVIGERYPLRQMWGFKYDDTLPANSTTHADFAAVNVNFWITPTEANLDEGSGGLILYDVDAPPEWDFDTYNGRVDMIRPYLQGQQAQTVTIPYRQNRAIVFDSDLFHATAGIRFQPEYEARRINITMLYGERADDAHHGDRVAHGHGKVEI